MFFSGCACRTLFLFIYFVSLMLGGGSINTAWMTYNCATVAVTGYPIDTTLLS
jgi:hypothetical protein